MPGGGSKKATQKEVIASQVDAIVKMVIELKRMSDLALMEELATMLTRRRKKKK